MKPRIGVTITILHVGFLLNIIVAIGSAWLAVSRSDTASDSNLGVLWFVVVVCAVLAVGQEITVWGLKQRKFWAWVSGVCLSALIVPTIFLPLGALSLWGLLAAGSLREFGMGAVPATGAIMLAIFTMVLQDEAHAAMFVIPDAGVVFEAPAGFTLLSQDELAIRYPNKRPSQIVVGNERRTTTITYEWRNDKLPPEDLVMAKPEFEKGMERALPDLEWIRKDIVSLRGWDWIKLEMISHKQDTNIHNIFMMTSHQGRLLVFNFNSTKEEFPTVERALRRSIDSIALGPMPKSDAKK
jgi:hypothetical protein